MNYLTWALFLLLCNNIMDQKTIINYSLDMNSEKLENLSGFVSEIVIKKINGDYSKSGTALFIKHKGKYYAVTAKHCFMNGSSQAGKTVPTIKNTNEKAIFFSGLDSLGKVKILHREKLHDGKNIFFKVYKISDLQAIDVAALKLTEPSEKVKSLAISSNYLDNSCNIYYKDKLVITGFPAYQENMEDSVKTGFASKEIQEMLDDDQKYYFMMTSSRDLSVKSMSGFSGSAILDKDKHKIIGFVAGENKKLSLIYGIYAKYMFDCLNSFSN